MPAPLAVLRHFLLQLPGFGEGRGAALQQPLHQQPEPEGDRQQTGSQQHVAPARLRRLSVSVSSDLVWDISFRVVSGGCGTTPFADRPSRPSSLQMLTTPPRSTEVRRFSFSFFLPPFQMSVLALLLDKIQFICLPVSLPLHPQLRWGTISSLIQCCRLTLEPLHTTRCWLRATVSRSPPQVSHLQRFFFFSCLHSVSFFLKDPPFLTQCFVFFECGALSLSSYYLS